MRLNRDLILLVIALILVFVLVRQAGGLTNILTYDCRRAAAAMGLNWMWDPARGCFIQQPNGSWMPIDQYTGYLNQP